MFGHRERLYSQMVQTCIACLAELVSPLVLPVIWLAWSIFVGSMTAVPDVVARFSLNPLVCMAVSDLFRLSLFDGKIAGAGVLILFCWWVRSLAHECWIIYDGFVPRSNSGRWGDMAPFVIRDGVYGYASRQYYVKAKSGHSRPKRGGDLQPITFRSPMTALVTNSFLRSFGVTVGLGVIAILVSANDIWFCKDRLDESEANTPRSAAASVAIEKDVTGHVPDTAHTSRGAVTSIAEGDVEDTSDTEAPPCGAETFIATKKDVSCPVFHFPDSHAGTFQVMARVSNMHQ